MKPPFSQFNMELIEWERDFLPEHLWIELLADEYKQFQWYKIYNDFLDKLEEAIGDEKVCLFGFLTDFGTVSGDARKKFISENKKFIYESFYKPIGKILTLYPENPANWLNLDEWRNEDRIEFEVELAKLRRSVFRLMQAKDPYAGHLRAVPLNRLFKHKRIYLNKDLSVVELIPKYPEKCTDDEKYRVQSFARTTMNMEYMREDRYKSREWPKYFWRHNYDLSPCIPSEINLPKGNRISEKKMKVIFQNIEKNCDLVVGYLDRVAAQYKYDLYDTTRDEILLGLFSRLTRLYVLYVSHPNLWAGDLSGIFLRCLVDTGITLAYLLKKGTDDDFQNFKKYGEGKEKLLMLHLQDTYKGGRTIEDKDVAAIAAELGGGIYPELIEIDLAGWTKKNARQLALDAQFEKHYKLIYDPASSDIHGTWTSLKKSNLIYCENPLHRYHRLPIFFDPPLFLQSVRAAQEIYLKCFKVSKDKLKLPEMEESIREIDDKTN